MERVVEDRRIVTDGTTNCPAFALCDRQLGEKYVAYVRRHCLDHSLGEFDSREDAERNLGIWCFYYFHKFVYGNVTLTPQPFYEIHAFLAWDEWNEEDLEERVPIAKKKYGRIPDVADRRPGDVRLMKQLEVPRQCEKTSSGSNAYPMWRSLHEYYVNDRRVYPFMIRSETRLNAGDSLAKIRTKARSGVNVTRLFGIRLLRCTKCADYAHLPMTGPAKCPGCGETKKIRVQQIGLIDPTRGAGGTGKDSVTFRWTTNTAEVGQMVRAAEKTLASLTGEGIEVAAGLDEDEDFEPIEEEEEAVYSIRASGLSTRLMGQRPREYILDDIQSEDNSKTHEMRMKILLRFDEAKRQLEFGGRVLVYNTRKYVDDFAGKISIEPLRSLFHTLHRAVYWQTDEPDGAPFVVGGLRYYYPVKGNGEPALDATNVELLWRQMGERKFCTEYLNNPHADKGATFKRADFHVIDVMDPQQWARIPIEVRYGLGRATTHEEEEELAALKLKVRAYNFWDPAGAEEHSKRGDDDFGVGLRIGRYGAIFITCLSAGQRTATQVWDEVLRLNDYNRPLWNDYEMGVDEKNVKPSYLKWQRDKAEEVGFPPIVPMHWSHMPKSTKTARIEKMETWTAQTSRNDHAVAYESGFFILSDAGMGDPDLVEKYIGQWLAIGRNADHDDGPDATSRGIRYFMAGAWEKPPEGAEEVSLTLTTGVPFGHLRALGHNRGVKSWGDRPL